MESTTRPPEPFSGPKVDSYTIQDVPLGTRRQVRIVCIGAGYSGLLMAIIVSQKMQDLNVDFQIYEMNKDLGGTWLVNRFPGCRCDSPAHIYAYSFCPSPNWSNVYAKATEIHQYLKNTARQYGCDKYISYNRRVSSAIWNDETGQWQLKVTNTSSGIDFNDWCHVLINASGILNNWNWPQIEGISRFRGKIMHSAAWDESFDFTDKRLAVIGTGASGIQVLPELAKRAAHATLFARSPTWVAPQTKPAAPDSTFEGCFTDSNLDYSLEARERFSRDPLYLQLHRRNLADRRIETFKKLHDGRSRLEMNESFRANMFQHLGDSEKGRNIAGRLVPSFPVGCRRLTPGPDFLQALARDNVDIVWDHIQRITETGIQVANGSHLELDAIICATGFECSYAPRFTIRGRGDVDLAEQWQSSDPEAYFGTTVAGFPNFFMFVGPNSPVSNGGLVQAIQAQGVYIYKCITKLQVEGIRSMEVSRAAMDDYNVHSQTFLRDSVWAADCSSWYKRNTKDGRVVAVYPGSTYHFVEMMRKPRWEDYLYDYMPSCQGPGGQKGTFNRFAFLGNGLTKRETEEKSIGRTQTIDFEEYWSLMEIPAIYEE